MKADGREIVVATHTLAGTHRQVFCFRRKHAPRAVVVPEEKNCNRTLRADGLDADIATLVRRYSTESRHACQR